MSWAWNRCWFPRAIIGCRGGRCGTPSPVSRRRTTSWLLSPPRAPRTLAVHGTDTYRDAIESTLALARYTAERVSESEGLSLVCEPQLSVVLFRRDGWGWEDYDRWSARLLADQIAFVLPTSWDGAPVARLCFVHPQTTRHMVDEIISTIAA